MGEGLENSKRKRRAASPGEADAFEEQRPPKPARKRKAAEELAPQPNGAGTLASALLRASQPRTQNRSAAAIKDLLVQQHHKNQTLHDARARYARLVASKRRRLQQPGHQLQATRESGIEVIGKIMPPPSDTAYPSCVAVQHMGSIWLLNMPRIEESILFGVLLETFKLPPDDLLLPVRLSAEQVGGPHIFQWLCGLPRSHQDGIIADERILANGFKLRVIEASETSMPETISAAEHVALELCGMSTAMRSLDIGDLREMLLLLHGELSQSGSSARDSHASHDLGTSRPAKTVRFFQERARTLARKRIENLEKQQTLAAEAAVAAGRLLQLQRRNHKRSRSTPLSARPSTLDPHWLCPHGREMIALLSEVPSHTRK
ncbi:ATP-binding mismatch repair protein [Polyrhizophydium stewartii]|uniref:ATP-binding mismatch repair protein n=1 Tax=Polyrhizophydium stewartii TaxID=2732419 RepID=A0ABR4NGL0_9FUNG